MKTVKSINRLTVLLRTSKLSKDKRRYPNAEIRKRVCQHYVEGNFFDEYHFGCEIIGLRLKYMPSFTEIEKVCLSL